MFSFNSDLLWMFNTVHYIEGVCVCVCVFWWLYVYPSVFCHKHRPSTQKKRDLSKCKTACELCMLINVIDVFLSCL